MRGLLVGGLIAMLGAGCASSERMNRMSGGVFQEYSAPKSYRIRSQKFQAKTRALEKAGKVDVGNVEGTPVNVWPFFFSSDYYTSVLWPFIDWDQYGFAVRPFYNQEGDERAVLFPLSAWNPVNGDGWVLLAAWNKNGFGFIPFFWYHGVKDNFWYFAGPLLIRSKDAAPLTPRYYSRKSFLWLFPAYFSKADQIEKSFRDPLCFRKFTPDLKLLLAYRLAGTGIAVPRSVKELDKLRDDPETAKKLPKEEKNSFGIPLLFHASAQPRNTSWRALAYLIGGETSEKYNSLDILGPLLARWRDRQSADRQWTRDRLFLSCLLMTYFSHNSFLLDSGRGKAFRTLIDHRFTRSRNEDSAQFRRTAIPAINAELKKLDPAWKLPESVKTREIYRLWQDDFFRLEKVRCLDLPESHLYSGGFLPLFWYELDERNEANRTKAFFSFAGLTWYEHGPRSMLFWSVPLLTYRSSRSFRSAPVTASETFWIAPPLIWYSSMKEQNRNLRKIQPHETTWASSRVCTVDRSDFSALGLFYHGQMTYYAAKKGVDHKLVEDLRVQLPHYRAEAESFKKQTAAVRKELKKLQAEVEAEQRKLSGTGKKNRIPLLEKQLQHERKIQSLEQIFKQQTKLRKKIVSLQQRAQKIGFEFDAAKLADGELRSVDPLLDELFRKYTESRSQADYGSGFFYRKEIFHNGDFHWRFMGFLAGGGKNGDREQCHVLQFLYRFRRDGRKMEKIYFPFISIREDGTKRRFSFLGRIYQRTEAEGKSSGYILFIPF